MVAMALSGAPAADPGKRSAPVFGEILRPQLFDIPGVRIKMTGFFPTGRLTGKLPDILAECAPDRHDIDHIGDNRSGN